MITGSPLAADDNPRKPVAALETLSVDRSDGCIAPLLAQDDAEITVTLRTRASEV